MQQVYSARECRQLVRPHKRSANRPPDDVTVAVLVALISVQYALEHAADAVVIPHLDAIDRAAHGWASPEPPT
ncbi:hypothetical protein [Nocardia nova]|uniref:hypothetical protein n=1 Tax=Nocardia nova TaxID=37330 RepID=UPI000D4C24F4|nr:hypothetical protein [Nocardia nova]PPJ31712.1 hypothetical protein C5E41_07440 [Nocardia nova]